MITNAQAIGFLNHLSADQQGKNALVLTEWEQEFLASYQRTYRAWQWLTDGRVESVDRMWRRYGAELNFPHPLDDVNGKPKLAAADPTGCEYLVRPEPGARQQPCNAPAEFRQPGKLRYCPTHAEAVEQAMKRAGKKFTLVKFP